MSDQTFHQVMLGTDTLSTSRNVININHGISRLNTVEGPGLIVGDFLLDGTQDAALFDTTLAGRTATLPADPEKGDEYLIVSSSAINPVTVDRNGNNINGVAADFQVFGQYGYTTFTYVNPTTGWLATGNAPVDFGLEVSKGNVDGHFDVNKFGRAPSLSSGIAADVWDGADGVTSTPVWVPPTVPRIHNLVSTSAADAAGGTGMRTIAVFGLPDFDSKEVVEIVTLNGLTPVPTVGEFAIIHRKVGRTYGSGNENAGIITATAAVDGTVTAAILAGNNQTLMAIYGVPSTQSFFITGFQANVFRTSATTVVAEVKGLSNPDPANSGAFVLVADVSIANDAPIGRTGITPPGNIPGPAILKVQVISDSNNASVTSSFDGYLVDKPA